MEISPRDIDPYILYVGNLPLNVTKAGVKRHFKVCVRVDIGHPQQMKNTRYAFVRFANVDDAIQAYKSAFNTLYESRSMIVRFRRINGNVAVPGENNKNTKTAHKSEESTADKPSSQEISRSSSSDTRTSELSKALSDSQSLKTSIPSPVLKTISAQKSNQELIYEPDLSLVKQEPQDDDDSDSELDIKPRLINGVAISAPGSAYSSSSTFSEATVKSEFVHNGIIKREYVYNNEDDMDDDDDEDDEDFDASHDDFRIPPEEGNIKKSIKQFIYNILFCKKRWFRHIVLL